MYTRNGLTGRRSKYGNHRVEIDGIKFDSKAEANRYFTLRLLEKAGQISELTRQRRFHLTVNGVKICDYICDFSYFDVRKGRGVVEDVKSEATITPVYKLKRSLMKAVHDIDIEEITR